MSPSVAKALLQVLNEIPMLVDNILEDNMNQIKLLESKNTITNDDVEAYEEHKKEVDQQGSISKEELAKKWGVKV